MKVLVIMTTLMLTTACAPKITSRRIDVNTADEYATTITDAWVMKDTELAVVDIVKQMDNHSGYRYYLNSLARRPKLFVGEIQNQTAEAYFPIGDLNDELLNILSASGDYVLIDAAAREKILKEIQYQNDGMVDANQVKSIGKASGADLMIFGDIRMKPATFNGKSIKEYSVNIRITDIEKGEEVFRGRYKVSKYSERNRKAW